MTPGPCGPTALAPLEVTCARCGTAGTLYPYPLPEGTMWCPNCSPAWLHNFLQSAMANTLPTICDPTRPDGRGLPANDGMTPR